MKDEKKNVDEMVLATIEPKETTNEEEELTVQVSDIETIANTLVVLDEKDYEAAGEFGVKLKTKIAEVTEFFAPMKKAAHEAHKNVCDREKQMLAPLKSAEATLKKTMGEYVTKKERERREAEERARKLAREESERKLTEAAEAERKGDIAASEAALLDAEISDTASRSITINKQQSYVKGVSAKTDWEITDIDASKVPDDVMGVTIRPVDEKAVIKLIRASKGKVQIPGITYKEVSKMSFRRS